MEKFYFTMNEWGNLEIIRTADGKSQAVGSIGRGLANKDVSNSPAIGYSLDMRYRQRGIMSRALKTFLDHTKYNSLQAVVKRNNIASQKTLLKCGFILIHDIEGEHLVFEWTRTKENRLTA